MTTNTKTKAEVHRVPLTSIQIAALLDYLNMCSNKYEQDTNVIEAYKKLKLTHFKIEEGIKTPDYVHIGRVTASQALNTRLGFSEQEIWFAGLTQDQKNEYDLDFYDWQFQSPENMSKTKEQYYIEIFEKTRSTQVTQSTQSIQSSDDVAEVVDFNEVGSEQQDLDIAAQMFGL